MTPPEPPPGLTPTVGTPPPGPAPTIGVPPPALDRTLAAPAPFESAGPPRAVGPYEVVRELGRGGMGVVYEARHPDLPGRALALKLILGGASPDALSRFGREAEVLARVRHRGVVTVHQLGRAPEGPYLVTDFVAGQGLGTLLRDGPLPPRRAAEVVRELADALAAVHAQGVLHRDLKPDNVILREDGSPVLLDFGIARDGEAQRLTATGALLGTPAYMAPEQAAGTRTTELDGRVDVYGLGAILFSLLSGRLPFDGASLQEVLKHVMFDEPQWPSRTRPDVPPGLEAICRVAMAREREARYASAAALRADLDRWLRGEQPEAAARFGRPRGPLLAAGLALGALVLGVAALLAREGPGADPVAPVAPVATLAPTTTAEPAPAPGSWQARLRGRTPSWTATPHLVLRATKEAWATWAAFLDDDHVVTVTKGVLRVWTLDGSRPVQTVPPPEVTLGDGTWSFARRPDGKLVVASSRGRVGLVTVADGSPSLARWPLELERAQLAEAVAPLGDDLVVARVERDPDARGRSRSQVLSVSRDGRARPLFTLPDTVQDLAVRGDLVAAASANVGANPGEADHGAIVVHHVLAGEDRVRVEDFDTQCFTVAFDPSGDSLAVGQGRGRLDRIAFATSSRTELRSPGTKNIAEQPSAHVDRIRQLAFDPSPPARLWTVGGDKGKGEVRGWSAAGAPLDDRSLVTQADLCSVDVAPSGRAVVVGTRVGEAHVWLLPAPQ